MAPSAWPSPFLLKKDALLSVEAKRESLSCRPWNMSLLETQANTGPYTTDH